MSEGSLCLHSAVACQLTVLRCVLCPWLPESHWRNLPTLTSLLRWDSHSITPEISIVFWLCLSPSYVKGEDLDIGCFWSLNSRDPMCQAENRCFQLVIVYPHVLLQVIVAQRLISGLDISWSYFKITEILLKLGYRVMGFIMSCLYFLFILLPWIFLPPAGSPTPVALCSFMVHVFYRWYPPPLPPPWSFYPEQ